MNARDVISATIDSDPDEWIRHSVRGTVIDATGLSAALLRDLTAAGYDLTDRPEPTPEDRMWAHRQLL